MSTALYIAFGIVIFLLIIVIIAISTTADKLLIKIYENKEYLQEIKNDLNVLESKYLKR